MSELVKGAAGHAVNSQDIISAIANKFTGCDEMMVLIAYSAARTAYGIVNKVKNVYGTEGKMANAPSSPPSPPSPETSDSGSSRRKRVSRRNRQLREK